MYQNKIEVSLKTFAKLATSATSTSQIMALVGASGFGKSRGTEANLNSKNSMTLVISEVVDSIEIIPDMSTGISKTIVDEAFLKAITAKRKKPFYVILDELQTLADYSEEKLNRVRQLLVERRIGTAIKVGPKVQFILLGNRGEDTAHGLEYEDFLPNMLHNNIAYYDIEIPTVPQWMREQKEWNKTPFEPLLSAIAKTFTTFPTKVMTPRSIIQCSAQLNNITDEESIRELYPLILRGAFGEYAEQIENQVISARLNIKELEPVATTMKRVESIRKKKRLSVQAIESVLDCAADPKKAIELLIKYNSATLTQFEAGYEENETTIVDGLFTKYKVSERSIKIYKVAVQLENTIRTDDYIKSIEELNN